MVFIRVSKDLESGGIHLNLGYSISDRARGRRKMWSGHTFDAGIIVALPVTDNTMEG